MSIADREDRQRNGDQREDDLVVRIDRHAAILGELRRYARALFGPNTVHFRLSCEETENLTLEQVRARQYSGRLWVAAGEPAPHSPPPDCVRWTE